MTRSLVTLAAVTVFCMGLGALARGQDLAELEVDHALTLDFTTPHTDWAQPYAGQKTRVLIFCDGITRCWKKIIYFKPVEPARPIPAEERVAAEGFDVPEGYKLFSDDRGVRIVPAA